MDATNNSGSVSSETEFGLTSFTTDSAKPYAETFIVEDITTNSATLLGVIRPHTPMDQQTTVTFEWGLDTDYGELEFAAESPLTPDRFGSYELVSLAITGLLPGKTYHYRVVAGNFKGTTEGTDRTFTTLAAAPVILGTSADNVSGNTADVVASVKPNGADTRVYFQYSTDMSYSTEVEAVNSPLLASGAINQIAGQELTRLSLNTTYNVRARAVNTVYGTQNEVAGQPVTFTTSANSDLPNLTTRTPDNITATAARSGGDILSQENTPEKAFGVCWDIVQSPDLGDTCADGSGSNIGVFLSDIKGLTPDTVYYVRAYATNGAGTAFCNEVPFRTEDVLAYVNPDGVCNNTPCFTTINFALGSVDAGTKIRIRTGTYAEDVVLVTDKKVKLTGGWAESYAGQDDASTVQTLTIEKGSVEIDKVILQQNP